MLRMLADPLPIALGILLLGVIGCWFGQRKARAIALISITVIFLTALSMPIIAERLHDSLDVPHAADMTPDYIVVLSGGMKSGPTADLDMLDEESTKRVLFGVQLWKRHPSARLVLTGAGPLVPNPIRKAQLMAELALCRGVPAASIVIEPRAKNTREHPVRLRAMGIPSASRLAIVTSRWHERRAMYEFRKYFPNASPQPVPYARKGGATGWFPDAPGLQDSSYATREWAGIVWYRVLDALGR